MNAATQAEILKTKIEQAEQVIWSACVDKRAGEKMADKEMVKRATETARKWEGLRTFYEDELKQITKGA